MSPEIDNKPQIREIIKTIDCKRDFICCKSGFTDLCKVKDIGIEEYVECLEKDYQDCGFSIPFGYSRLCCCKLRVFIAKELNK